MINVIVNSDSRYPINKLAIQAAVIGVLNSHRIIGDVEIGITIVGDRKMHEINKRFRGIDSPTNILSFAYEDPIYTGQLQHIRNLGFVKSPDKKLYQGDILISYAEAIKDAAADGVSVEEIMSYLVEHGTKHLLGLHPD